MANAKPVVFQEETKAKVADKAMAAKVRKEALDALLAEDGELIDAPAPLPPRAKAVASHNLGQTGITVRSITY